MVKTYGGWLWSVLLLGCLVLASCGSQSEFSNKLTFGTDVGGNGFTLVGERDTFSLAELGQNNILFRLESAADIGDRFVRLYIYSTGSSGSSFYNQKDYTPGQNYGHIFLSGFRITDEGTYQVRAYLPEAILDIADESNHVVDANLTMGP